MPPLNHAVLSASSSHRWLHCPPSAQLEKRFPNRSSTAAEEGTAAHALCEYKLQKALKQPCSRPQSVYDCPEMEQHTTAYAEWVLRTLQAEKHTAPLLQMEQRLDFSRWVPEGFGTGDCLILTEEQLHIIDFKYGIGVLVEAEHNTQMMLYALGALDLYDCLCDVKNVSMTIYQTRRDNICTWTIPKSELLTWAEAELKPKAELAAAGKGVFCSGDWCRFCRAKPVCPLKRSAPEDEFQPITSTPLG